MFTQNQVRQFYVAKVRETAASGLDTAGDIMVATQGDDVYFNYVNADGEVMRTDLIDKKKIMSITMTPAVAMKYTSKATYITLSPDVLDSANSNNPVAGEDYMLNIKCMNLDYPSEQNPTIKYGVAHTTSSTTPSDFYKILAKSLAANLSRDMFNSLKVYTTSATSATAVTTGNITEIKTDADIPTGEVKAIVIDEAKPTIYEVHSDEIYVSGEETKWGVETEIKGFTIIENGAKIADMEKFYHGERGDIYRGSAFPTEWPNKMLVDPTQKYDTIDIHYYWNGANHAIQKSEKDITIACATGVTSNLVSDIKTAIPDASGLTYSATGVSTVILG